MIDLTQLFSAVCGQNLDHCWAPGGVWLPFCHRCTGLYSGAGIAILAYLWLKPRPTARFLAVHGTFLVIMVPFGFHWLAQGPILRAITGLLFGFAVGTFLCLPLIRSKTHEPFSSEAHKHERVRHTLYGLVLCSNLLLVPWIGTYGGKLSFALLTLQGVWGAMALSMLILANAWRGAMGACNMLIPAAARTHAR